MLPFEFVIEGPPVSQQTRRRARRQAWVEAIRARIRGSWPADEPPVESALLVSLSYLFIEVAVDLDNVAKPFLDALKGIAYQDDGQVTDLILRKRSLSATLEVENPSELLATSIEAGREFLHVTLQEAPAQEVLP